MSETGDKTGLLAMIAGVFALLLKFWGAIPEKSRDKLISTILDGFEGILRRFFRKFHGVETQPGEEMTP